MYKHFNTALWMQWLKKILGYHDLKVLGFDLDEPILDVWTPIKQFFAEEYDTILEDHQWTTYQLEKNPYLKDKAPNIQEAIKRIKSPEFHIRARPDPEAVACLNYLYNAGYKIHIITARGEKGFSNITVEQLKKYHIPYDSLNFCPLEEKPIIADKLGVQFFVDDHPEAIETFLQFHTRPAVLAILDRPWNQDVDETKYKNVHRVYGWLAPKSGPGIMKLIRKKSW